MRDGRSYQVVGVEANQQEIHVDLRSMGGEIHMHRNNFRHVSSKERFSQEDEVEKSTNSSI
jgi:predicted rRNA methylase YqxC with S4 and FtsJ domains